jgi:hypothetical protein
MLPKRLKKKNKNFFETEIRLGIGLGQDWYRNVINSTLGFGKRRRNFELLHFELFEMFASTGIRIRSNMTKFIKCIGSKTTATSHLCWPAVYNGNACKYPSPAFDIEKKEHFCYFYYLLHIYLISIFAIHIYIYLLYTP